MKKNAEILLINTGGTFNKYYDPVAGELLVDTEGKALKALASKWQCELEILNIIGKDSLEISSHDRLELLAMLSQSDYDKIIVIHGTDTMSQTAAYLADADLEKRIVLTGAMVPYAIDPVDATANFASAWGYIQDLESPGVYIAMNGRFNAHHKMRKDKKKGRFTSKPK